MDRQYAMPTFGTAPFALPTPAPDPLLGARPYCPFLRNETLRQRWHSSRYSVSFAPGHSLPPPPQISTAAQFGLPELPPVPRRPRSLRGASFSLEHYQVLQSPQRPGENYSIGSYSNGLPFPSLSRYNVPPQPPHVTNPYHISTNDRDQVASRATLPPLNYQPLNGAGSYFAAGPQPGAAMSYTQNGPPETGASSQSTNARMESPAARGFNASQQPIWSGNHSGQPHEPIVSRSPHAEPTQGQSAPQMQAPPVTGVPTVNGTIPLFRGIQTANGSLYLPNQTPVQITANEEFMRQYTPRRVTDATEEQSREAGVARAYLAHGQFFNNLTDRQENSQIGDAGLPLEDYMRFLGDPENRGTAQNVSHGILQGPSGELQPPQNPDIRLFQAPHGFFAVNVAEHQTTMARRVTVETADGQTHVWHNQPFPGPPRATAEPITNQQGRPRRRRAAHFVRDTQWRASTRAIESFVEVKLDELDEEDRECAICMESYGDIEPYKPIAENPVRLPCGHVFGNVCIVTWLQDHVTCPTCRHKLESERIMSPITPRFPHLEHQPVQPVQPVQRVQPVQQMEQASSQGNLAPLLHAAGSMIPVSGTNTRRHGVWFGRPTTTASSTRADSGQTTRTTAATPRQESRGSSRPGRSEQRGNSVAPRGQVEITHDPPLWFPPVNTGAYTSTGTQTGSSTSSITAPAVAPRQNLNHGSSRIGSGSRRDGRSSSRISDNVHASNRPHHGLVGPLLPSQNLIRNPPLAQPTGMEFNFSAPISNIAQGGSSGGQAHHDAEGLTTMVPGLASSYMTNPQQPSFHGTVNQGNNQSSLPDGGWGDDDFLPMDIDNLI